jgi:hypothetical protein
MNGGSEKYVQNLIENSIKGTGLGNLDLDEMIILKWILGKWGVM